MAKPTSPGPLANVETALVVGHCSAARATLVPVADLLAPLRPPGCVQWEESEVHRELDRCALVDGRLGFFSSAVRAAETHGLGQ